MKALILGCLGQDGSYMTELLASKGYEVYGIIKPGTQAHRIEWLKSLAPIKTYSIDILEKEELYNLIQFVRPDEIYNFAGVSNVFDPWENLDFIYELNARVPQYIMECILKIDKGIKFFQASSCLVFGKDESGSQSEATPRNPIHPYGITKLYADNLVKEFRETFGLNCRSGIFFNHESPRRGLDFFTKKITTQVKEIKAGTRERIKVGDLSAVRDYGYAPDFMEAAHLTMQSDPTDYVIGTGQTISMMEFLTNCIFFAGLEPYGFIDIDKSLYRKSDTSLLVADTAKIHHLLGWRPKHNIDDIIKIMMQ